MRLRLLLTVALAFGAGFLLGPGFLRSTPVVGSDALPSATGTATSTVALVPASARPPAKPVDSCEPGVLAARRADYDEWAFTVLDAQRELSADYVPPDLIDASAANFDAGFQVRRVIVDALASMDRAAANDGLQLLLTSAYRSYRQQSDTFNAFATQLGAEAAARRAAMPGHSEHQLGTAVDFARSAGAYDWLAANASAYGFVASYARGDSCYEFEPWHYRYVGIDLAARVAASGRSLHDFLLSTDP